MTEYDLRHFRLVLASVPDLVARLERLGLQTPTMLARYLEAATLKCLARDSEALKRLEWILAHHSLTDDMNLRGRLLMDIAGCYGRAGDLQRALRLFEEALESPGARDDLIFSASVSALLGETYRVAGDLDRSAIWLGKAVVCCN